jgi:tetratricopeptide (TPR) repeat protein
MRRTINYKAVLILLACGVALGAGVHVVHGFQVRRNAGALLEQAKVAEQEGRPAEAADALEQYVSLTPDDTDALARYGTLLRQAARTPQDLVRAFLVLEQALRRDAGRADVRRQVAELGVRFGRFQQAREDLDLLLKDNPDDVALLQLRGLCELGDRKPDEAWKWYNRAIKAAPQDINLSADYAQLLRERLDSPATADAVIDRLVARNPQSAPAHLAAARYYQRAGAADRAEEEVRVAFEKPDARDADALLLAAAVARANGKKAEQRAYLEQGRGLYPQDLRLTLTLAWLELDEGRREQALHLVRPVVAQLPERQEELWTLAGLLIDLDETRQAEAVMERLRQRGVAWGVGYLRGRILARRGAWAEARNALERVCAHPLPPEAARQVNFLLAECHGRLGNPDQQVSACRRALERDPSWAPARRLLAAGLTALGRTDEAVQEYRRLPAADSPQASVAVVRLLLARNLRLPRAERRWSEVDKALEQIPEGGRRDPEVVLLRASVLVAEGKADDGRRLVEEERRRDPKQVGPWLFLAAQAEKQGRREAVLPLLADAERACGPRVEWDLARAGYWARGEKAQAQPHLHELEGRLDGLADADRARLLAGLAAASLGADDAPAAGRLWRQLADRQPANGTVRFVLFELALRQDHVDEARRLLGELRGLEGDDGPAVAYGEAALRLHGAGSGDRQRLAEARRLLGKAAAARPGWSRVALLEARLEDLEGHADKALEKYQAALEQGEGRLGVVKRVVQLLYQLGRDAEAAAFLSRLPEEALASSDLGRMAAELALPGEEAAANADPAAARRRALELARKAVPAGSTDYREYLWLGQMAAAAEQPADAEAAFRKATGLAPHDPEPWTGLVRFLARTDPKRAEAELTAARAQLPADQLPFVLAPAYEVLGRPKEAEEQYRALVAARPADPAVLRDAAGFYARAAQPEKARELLRQLIDPKTKAPDAVRRGARRELALSLAYGGNARQFREAEALLEANVKEAGETTEDRRTRALVLATQPGHRGEAIRLFESLSSGRALPPDVRFLVARLYEADGNWPRAEAQLVALLGEHGSTPAYLAYYAGALLRHQQADRAAEWVGRLERVRPGSFEAAELRARVLYAQGRRADAIAVLTAFARQEGARADRAALLLDQLGEAATAEPLYRAHLAASKEPAALLLLARNLGRQGRVPEALELCEQAWDKCAPEAVALVSVSVVRGPAGEAHQGRVEARLQAALDNYPQSVALLRSLAELQDVRGRYAGAIALYRRILRLEPHDVFALNNLAYLLALKQESPEEALDLVQKAIDEAGPHAELLDTRGLVYLQGGHAELALRDLRQAIAEGASASRYVHLAQADLLAEDRQAAGDAYRKATDLGLKLEDVHPLERPAVRQLAADLGRK